MIPRKESTKSKICPGHARRIQVLCHHGLTEWYEASNHQSDTKPAGKARIKGKEYVMRDGDVVEFRFNV